MIPLYAHPDSQVVYYNATDCIVCTTQMRLILYCMYHIDATDPVAVLYGVGRLVSLAALFFLKNKDSLAQLAVITIHSALQFSCVVLLVFLVAVPQAK